MPSNSHSSTVPSDCLREIFRHLEHDRNSLRACTLVNRDWCATAVEALWSQPFLLAFSCEENCSCTERTRQARSAALVDVHISCAVWKLMPELSPQKDPDALQLPVSPAFNYVQ